MESCKATLGRAAGVQVERCVILRRVGKVSAEGSSGSKEWQRKA